MLVYINKYGKYRFSLSFFIEHIFYRILIKPCSNKSVSYISVLAWHFTAVQCTLCNMVEDQEEDEEAEHSQSDAYRSRTPDDRKSVR